MITNKPPTIYAILNSIVNYGKPVDELKKINELAKYGRTTIFDFSYPLSTKVSKEDFEVMILNHFMTRRIGYDTVTAFKLFLSTKLNEIMPLYNKLFDALDGWDIFNDGEIVTRSRTDESSSEMSNYNVNDNRFSNMPEGKLDNVRDASYVTEYGYNQTNSNGSGTSNATTSETTTRTPADKIRIYKEFIQSRNSIYTMIFDELESLFYLLV